MNKSTADLTPLFLWPHYFFKRRSAIEAVIGHEKTEGRLGWNQLRGLLGDKVNALMAAIGYNLRMILKVLSFLAQILTELFSDLADFNVRFRVM